MAWLTDRRIGLTHQDDRSYPGYTLFSSVSGHHATIIDSEGLIVHQWQHDEGIQHVKLINSGHLLMQTLPAKEAGGREKIGGSAGAMIELDAVGNVIWEHRDIAQHHDYVRLDNGHTLYLAMEKIPADLVKQVAGGHDREDDDGSMWGDVVRQIDRTGVLVSEWRSWEHLDVAEQVICPLESRKEWTHANSFTVLPDGHWLISLRSTSNLIMVNAVTGDITWTWGADELSHQHDAQMLPNGNILVFDNGCHRKNGPSFSRILEINPDSRSIEWSYFNPTVLAFFSYMVSGCQRLPNGNTLITEGASGRLFEVTAKREVVWEYVSPWTIPSGFGPTPAVFRSYRLDLDDPRLTGYALDADHYQDLNRAIQRGEVQTEPDFEHHMPQRQGAPDQNGDN